MTDSAITKLSPTVHKALRTGAATTDQLLVELIDQLKADAMAIDPTIQGVWLYRDLTLRDRDPAGAVQGLFFDRGQRPTRRPIIEQEAQL